MKKITLLFAVVMCLSMLMTVCVSAESDIFRPRVVDYADVLTDGEEAQLLSKLNSLSEREQYDIVVVTSADLNGKSDRDYADDFYDNNGYGMGENYDGVLLLISTEGRGSIYMSTCGMPYECLSDSDIDTILDYAFEYFADYDYYNTCVAFADKTVELVSSSDNVDDGEKVILRNAAIAVIAGIIIAIIVVSAMKSQLNSVKVQNEASDYVRKNSLKITGSSDIFLYKNLSKTARPKDNGSSGGSSGRSSGGGGGSHVSSSGRTHGGGGRSR